MSKSAKKLDRSMSGQPGLFDTTLSEGAFDILLGLKQCMSREMTACSKDRYLIAAEISRLLGRNISKEMLDKYVSSDPAYRPDADFLTAFCYVVNSLEPFRYLLEPLGADVVNPEDRDLIRLARLEEKSRELQAEIMKIRSARGMK